MKHTIPLFCFATVTHFPGWGVLHGFYWQVWDDNSMWNRDFSELCPSYTLARLNELEVAVLEILRVSVRNVCDVTSHKKQIPPPPQQQQLLYCDFRNAADSSALARVTSVSCYREGGREGDIGVRINRGCFFFSFHLSI